MTLRTFTLHRRLLAVLLLPIFALTSCATALHPDGVLVNSNRPSVGASKEPAKLPEQAAGSDWIIASERYPLSTKQRASTDSAIYLGNLNAQIDVLSLRIAETDDGHAAASLVMALLQRLQIIGRHDDFREAQHWSGQAVAWAPSLPLAWRARAGAMAAVHRFDQASAALDKALQLGVAEAELAPLRRDIQVGLGRYAELRADLSQADRPVADFHELAHRADLLLLQGDLLGASLWFRSAQDFYQDVDPLPLAWLYVQQGIALLRFEQVAEARLFFQAAHDRLPDYYLATEHLAECEARLGNWDRARRLYRQVIEQTAAPEFMAALADLESSAGRPAESERWQSAAASGFERMVAEDEAAFGQHAAEFWLSNGQPERALNLARHNLQRRSDLASLLLAARAEQAVGDWPRACAVIQRIEATGLQPPELAQIAAARSRCQG